MDSKGYTLLRTVITQTRLDIVSDSYQPSLIKISERHRSGLSSKIYIKSSKSRVPRNFGNFLLNGQKEQRMVEIIFSTFQAKKHILNYLKINQFIISKQNLSKSITLSAVRIVESPSSNQVEADKRVTFHCYHALKSY